MLLLADPEERRWPEGAEDLLQETAERTSAALVRARTDRALTESEARFRLAEEAANGFLYDWNWVSETPSVTWSDGFHRLLGHPEHAVPRTRAAWSALVHPDDRAKVTEASEPSSGDGRYSIEYRLRHHDGHYLDVQDRGRLIRDNRGRPQRIIGSVVDVTERHRAEERNSFLLMLSNALRSLADAAAIKAAASQILGRHLGANRTFYAEVDGEDWLVRDAYEYDVERMAEGRHYIPAFGQWIVDLFRAGRPLIIRDLDTDDRFDPAQRDAHAAYRIVAAIAVPLVKDDALVAILVVHSAVPREWRPPEITLVEETAERTWAAVERARAEAARHDSEEQLRRAMHRDDRP